ncbi:hypothetical protein SADUNF_Sadunf01G0083200 [Salix dunnii]|uniref:Uncharacterized protein n=1 Tax=Salix dunnii TaxID=1413687 RepID=A0A835NAH0_9ROSI|nr:hypothetical protein SADUNF_Sadunf01G0083200 [Salix dunnii]
MDSSHGKGPPILGGERSPAPGESVPAAAGMPMRRKAQIKSWLNRKPDRVSAYSTIALAKGYSPFICERYATAMLTILIMKEE